MSDHFTKLRLNERIQIQTLYDTELSGERPPPSAGVRTQSASPRGAGQSIKSSHGCRLHRRASPNAE